MKGTTDYFQNFGEKFDFLLKFYLFLKQIKLIIYLFVLCEFYNQID